MILKWSPTNSFPGIGSFKQFFLTEPVQNSFLGSFTSNPITWCRHWYRVFLLILLTPEPRRPIQSDLSTNPVHRLVWSGSTGSLTRSNSNEWFVHDSNRGFRVFHNHTAFTCTCVQYVFIKKQTNLLVRYLSYIGIYLYFKCVFWFFLLVYDISLTFWSTIISQKVNGSLGHVLYE